MDGRRLARSLFLGFSILLAGSSAFAQDEGFAINRFEPAERGSDWFTQDSLNISGHPRLALGLTLDWAHKPLVLYDANGDEVSAILRDQVFAHLGASITLIERLRLGINLPVGLYSGGDAGNLGGTTFDATDGATFGDVRLGADYLLYGKYRSPFSVAAGAWFWIPTGSQERFSGDGKVRLSPHVLVAGDIDMFAYAARMSVDYRAQKQTFGDSEIGSDLSLGASAGVRLIDDKLLLGPELNMTTSIAAADSFFGRTTTPFELIFGGHYTFLEEFKVGAGFGPGLSRGLGTPEWRGLLSFDWIQAVDEPEKAVTEPSDRDGDGIYDEDDACPRKKGIASDDPKAHGCPPPPDSDGDGIIDDDDACPEEPGVPSDDPKKNGCPLPGDADKDGIIDAEDACPNEPGIKTDDPKTNGCPAPKDTDEDTILDPEDACPTVKGPKNDNSKKNGCPEARIEKGQIRIIERVEFEYNSSKIQKGSERVLQAVFDILKEHPDIDKLSIEGHTDDRGNDQYNKHLSARRAEAVLKWFTARGIAKNRLSSVGYGEERPIASNETEEGRQDNRRVEFHIVEEGEKPAKNQP